MVTTDPLRLLPKNTPASWVAYTRAGCDFGAVALANVVLENTGTGPNSDITKVFGAAASPASCPDATHPEWCEASASNAEPQKPQRRETLQRQHSPRPTLSASRSTALRVAAFAPATRMPDPTSYRMSRVATVASRACSGPST